MMARRTTLAIVPVAPMLAFAMLAACSDDPERERFETPTPDANLPETANGDAGPAPDGRAPFDPADEEITCAATPCATDLVAGSAHFCARMSDGTVRCWGDDSYGALGGDPDVAGGAVRLVAGLTKVTQLSAGGRTTCARVEDGSVRCWGANTRGQLGLAVDPPVVDEEPHPAAEPVALEEPASRVFVGHENACAVLASGKTWCWGSDDQAQLARGFGGWEQVGGPAPANVGALAIARTASGTATTLALTPGGDLYSWGALSGDEGLLSGRISSISPHPAPGHLATLSKVTSLAVSATVQPEEDFGGGFPPPPPPPPRAHACALAGGEVYCWGRSDRGALCTGMPDREPLPRYAPVRAKAWPQQLAVADEITCARLTDGTIQCCGDDAKGRLGRGKSELLSAFFTPATAFEGHAVKVATSDGAVCALVQGGTVECWGSNANGELALPAPDDAPHPSPTKVAF
jgi:alpha-tubulin suppressor-like RCC1 family protein